MFCLTRGSIALTIQSRDPLSSFIKRNLLCVIDLSNASELRTVRHRHDHRAGQQGNTDLTRGIRRQLRGGGSRINGGHLWTALGECNVSLIAIFWSLFNGAITLWSSPAPLKLCGSTYRSVSVLSDLVKKSNYKVLSQKSSHVNVSVLILDHFCAWYPPTPSYFSNECWVNK